MTCSASRSHILSLVAKSSPPRPPRTRDPADSDVYLKILTSPLRRCILTQKVLPSALLVHLTLAREELKKEGGARTFFTPSKILHPRFSEPVSGRGAWVLCSSLALESLASKGAYKRLSPNAVFPSNTTEKIHSQLCRRMQQEFEMYGERIKCRPALSSAGIPRICPVRRLGKEEVDRVDKGGLEGMEREGMKLCAVVDLREREGGRFSILRGTTSSPSIPIYNLPHFLRDIILPPTIDEKPEPIVQAIEGSLEGIITRFTSRLPPSSPSPISSPPIYAMYQPIALTGHDDEGLQDIIPLLLSLWRCRLWTGEGWEEPPSSL